MGTDKGCNYTREFNLKIMQVLKFGGTSVANAQNINKVIAIVKETLKNDKAVVVSSAIIYHSLVKKEGFFSGR